MAAVKMPVRLIIFAVFPWLAMTMTLEVVKTPYAVLKFVYSGNPKWDNLDAVSQIHIRMLEILGKSSDVKDEAEFDEILGQQRLLVEQINSEFHLRFMNDWYKHSALLFFLFALVIIGNYLIQRHEAGDPLKEALDDARRTRRDAKTKSQSP